jgi:hypothetical protein
MAYRTRQHNCVSADMIRITASAALPERRINPDASDGS